MNPTSPIPEYGQRLPRSGVLRTAQCAQLLRSAGLLAVGQLAVAVTCVLVLRGDAPVFRALAWLAGLGFVQSAALLLWQGGRVPDPAESVRGAHLHAWLRTGSVLSGLLWGALPWALPPAGPGSAGFVAFAVACVCGGVTAAIGFDALAAWGFAAAALLPLSAWLSLSGGTQAQVLALMASAWLLFLTLAALDAQRRFAHGLAWRVRARRERARRERQQRRTMQVARLGGVVAEIGRLAAEAGDVGEFGDALCRFAVRHAALAQAWIAYVDGPSDEPRDASRWPAQAALLGRRQAALACSEARAVFEVTGSDGHGPSAPTAAVGVAALPIRGSRTDSAPDAVIGVLVLCFPEHPSFDETATQVLLQVGTGVERGLHALEQRRRMTQLQSLYRALMNEGEVLLQARNVPDMLLRTCQTLTDGTPFHAVWMARPDDGGHIDVVARAGSGADQLDALDINLHDADNSPLVIRVWNSHRDVLCNDLLGDARLAPWRASMDAYEWRSALAVPVVRADVLWGVLVFVAPQAHAFDPPTIELCRRVAELLGRGLDELDIKRRLNDLQLEESHRARHDVLTGLPNRFALSQYLPQALAAARRDGSVLAVGMIDLDDFKPVNDTWGHDAGDRLLREFGERMRAAIRRFDVLARLGGDEFIVVIEQVDSHRVLEQLGDVLQRLHAAVQAPFEVAPGCRARVGMTMGLALYPLDGQDPDALLRQADAAMYQAKLHKRDRTRWWQLAAASAARLEGAARRAQPQLRMVGSDRGAKADDA